MWIISIMRKSEGQKIPEKEIVKEKPASTIAYEVSEFINLTITKHVGKVKDEELYSKST